MTTRILIALLLTISAAYAKTTPTKPPVYVPVCNTAPISNPWKCLNRPVREWKGPRK